MRSCTVSGYPARCGTLRVTEDRLTGTGPTIPLRVVVVPATGNVRQIDPIVWFQGGPGSSAVDYVGGQMPLFQLDMGRDVVFIDQRGTGASNLTCPAFPSPLGSKAALRAGVKSCLQHLKADLRFYTTAMFTDDVNEILSDLHYRKVNVVGGSYGATSAQVFLLRHPDRVRTMSLLSGTPLNVPIFERIPETAQRALDNVFAECRREAACDAAFPHLAADWASLWASVSKAPWVVPAKLSPTHQQVVFDSDQLASSVHQLLMDAKTQTALPLAVHLLATAKDKAAVVAALAKAIPPDESTSGNQMMAYAIRCNEPWARYDPSRLVGKSSFEYHFQLEDAQWWQYVCAFIPKAGPAAGTGQLTRSLTPVLALNGEEDPQDPPANMVGAKTFWPNGLELAVPDQGHQIDPELSGYCVISILDSFIDHGTVARLDRSCLSQVPPPAFAVTLQEIATG